MGLFGHSSGGGAAARAAIDIKRTSNGAFLKALAGLGIFVPATRLDVEELQGLRDIAVLQMAGQRDIHVTPRAVATSVEAMRYTAPRATAVIRRGTHCWLDEAASYVYPVRGGEWSGDQTVTGHLDVPTTHAHAVTHDLS